jgi:hypothetical protein
MGAESSSPRAPKSGCLPDALGSSAGSKANPTVTHPLDLYHLAKNVGSLSMYSDAVAPRSRPIRESCLAANGITEEKLTAWILG